MEQGAEQRVLQPQEEEVQISLNEEQLKAAERRKETEADWEEGATVNKLGLESCRRRVNGVTGLKKHQEVVGKGEEKEQTRESEQHLGDLVKIPLAKLSDCISRMDPERFRVLPLKSLRMLLLPVAVSSTFQATTAQQSGRVVQKEVRCRKCCRSNIQGRRRASVHKRHTAGLGHITATQLRRTTQEEGGRGGRSCAEGGKKKERGHIP